MVTLFHDMMHKEIEVYVDNLIAKSHTPRDHLRDLRKLFKRLFKYRLRLNPNKCVFKASLGKLLGFIVSWRGIEVDLAKVLAIVDMPTLKIEKKVRNFVGRINYIACFIAKLTATCDLLFKIVRLNLFNHVLALFHAKFACNSAIRYLVFRWELF